MPICGYSSVSLPPRYHPHYHLITTLQMAKHGLIVYIVGKNTSSARRNVGAAQKLFMLFFLINNPRCFSLSRTKKRTEVRFPASHLSPFAFHLSPFTFHLSPFTSPLSLPHRCSPRIHSRGRQFPLLFGSQPLVAGRLFPAFLVPGRQQPATNYFPASSILTPYFLPTHTAYPATSNAINTHGVSPRGVALGSLVSGSFSPLSPASTSR